MQKTEEYFSIFPDLFIRFGRQRGASCCKGRKLNDAGGDMKDGRSGCRVVDMKEFPSIWPPLSTLCQGLLAGQVLPLGCAR